MATIAEKDLRHLLHPFTSIADHQASGPHMFERAEGIHVYDADGNQYIDAMAGLWCSNIGYGRKEMAEAVASQIEKMSYYHSFMAVGNEPAAELGAKLAEVMPGNINRFFYCNSGSEANDSFVKLVRFYNNVRGLPKKKKFIGRVGGYHGVTVAAASLSSLPHLHAHFDVPSEGFIHVRKPHYYHEAEESQSEEEFTASLAGDLEETIAREGADTIAAFIAEPVMGAGGVIPPPKGYFDAIVPILREHDILFIADEVVCGFGRLGTWSGSEYFNMQPDLMTLAKGLTSGYVPMSACGISDEIYEVLHEKSGDSGPFGHGYTYSAHPVSAAAGVKNLEIIERENLVGNAAEVGAYLQAQLAEKVAPHPLVGEHRGIGMIAGIELVKNRETKEPFDLTLGITKRMYKHMLTRGLICRPIMNMLAFSPPLILTKDDVDTIVAKFADALDALAEELDHDGIWQP